MSVSEKLALGDSGNQIEEKIWQVTEETPQFNDISIKNIQCKGAYQSIFLQGLPEMNLENIQLENIFMEGENGLTCIDADGVIIKNMKLITSNYPAYKFINTKNVSVDGLDMTETGKLLISVEGEKTENVSFKLISNTRGKNILSLGENVNPEAVKLIEN